MRFTCRHRLSFSAAELCDQIFTPESWTSWRGYGPVPGIAEAVVIPPADAPESRLGTRFEVTNEDGSRHAEVVVEYEPARRLVMKMGEFNPPLSYLAKNIIETWQFDDDGDSVQVARSFDVQPKNAFSAVPLWFITRLLKAATARHLVEMDRIDPAQSGARLEAGGQADGSG